MPLSNTTLNTLRAQPYWDDFSKDNRFHRVLFRPKYPVQTREINQIQSILQNQIEQFGAGVFKEGAAVRGGGQAIVNSCYALQLQREDTVDIANFYDANTGVGYLVQGATSGAEATIVEIARQSDEDFTAVLIIANNSKKFLAEEEINFINPANTTTVVASLTAAPTTSPDTPPTRQALMYTVSAGTFFARGHFVETQRQTTVLSTDGRNVSRRIGFEVTEDIVTEETDSTLYDPALGTANYGAPGAHRLKLTLTLTNKPIIASTTTLQDSEENFVELARIEQGRLVEPTDRLAPTLLEDTLAERTYDESGNYVVDPFVLVPSIHIPDRNTPNCRGTLNVLNTSTVIIAGNVVSSVRVNELTDELIETRTVFTEDVEVGDILIVGEEEREITQIVNNTVLRVNSAFSFSYSEVPFCVQSDNRMTFVLDPGVAYVQGYRIATNSSSYVEVRRPRTTRAIDNGAISTNFGPYLLVNREKRLLNLYSTPVVDLHCANSFGDLTAGAYANTKIGTARFRGLVPVESSGVAGTGNSSTVYKFLYVAPEFETKTFAAGIVFAVNADAGTLTLNNQLMAISTNNALVGAGITVYNSANVALKYTIVSDSFSASANLHTVVLSPKAFISTVSTSKTAAIAFNEKCIRSISSSSALTYGATVGVFGRVGNVANGVTAINGTGRTPAFFAFNQSWISANTLTDVSYDTFIYLTSITQGTIDSGFYPYTITRPNADVQFYATANGFVYLNYVVSNTTSFVNLTDAKIDMSGENPILYINSSAVGAGAAIDVYARARLNVNTDTGLRTKTLRTANTSVLNVEVSSSQLISNLSTGRGHIAINTINVTSPTIISLGTADIYQIRKVYAVTTTNTTNITGSVDVSDRYDFDNGQRDWCYDHASLVLKPGQGHYPATHKLLVMVDWFEHSSNSGPFFARSYADSGLLDGYNDIPLFENVTGGTSAALRDVVDFRPMRQRDLIAANVAYNPYSTANTIFLDQVYPDVDGTLLADYEHYLDRIDNIILRANGVIEAVTGNPSLSPKPPVTDADAMVLYQVRYTPYLSNVSMIQVTPFDYKRYTMSDIGKLEKRIERLEYYTTLSIVENQTLQDPEFDADDNERFKNGILVDQFAGHSIADVKSVDYKASMDSHEGELWPRNYAYTIKLQSFESGTMVNHVDRLVTVPYTLANLIVQPYATKHESVNPYNIATWNGRIILDPQSDIWFDTVKFNVMKDIGEENSNWPGDGLQTQATEWGPWNWHWQGIDRVEQREPSQLIPMDVDDDPRDMLVKVSKTKSFGRESGSRVGLQNQIKRSTTLVNLGDSVVDIAVIPNMRRANVSIMATGLKPGANIYATFDNRNVTNLVERANIIQLNSDAAANKFLPGVAIEAYTGSGATRTVIGTGKVVAVTGSALRVVSTEGRFYDSAATVTIRQRTPNVVTILPASGSVVGGTVIEEPVSGSGRHYSGTFAANTAAGGTVLTLDTGAITEYDPYTGQTISITQGAGINRRYNITAYNTSTRQVTLSTGLQQKVIAGFSRYSIGSLRVDDTPTTSLPETSSAQHDFTPSAALVPGAFYGVFNLPGQMRLNNEAFLPEANLEFSTGSKTLKLADNVVAQFSTTSAQGIYTATGTQKTVANTTLRNRTTVVTPRLVSQQDSREFSFETTEYEATGQYVDPLAQTFIVDSVAFPEGIFLAAVDLFFAKISSKGTKFELEIRRTQDGNVTEKVIASCVKQGASNFNVVPLNADGTDYVTPDAKNPAHYTRFTFEEPVFLESGYQFALVLRSNDADYRVFLAEMNKQVIGSTQVISEQPYAGSLFYSQNGSTWTPQQAEDLMFVIHRCKFDTTATFNMTLQMSETINTSSKNVIVDSDGNFKYDVFKLLVESKQFGSTRNNVSYQLSLFNPVGSQYDVYTAENGLALNEDMFLPDRCMVQKDATQSALLRIIANTTSNLVSPVFVLPSMGLTTVQYVIDNGALYSNGFTILNPGAGFTEGTFAITATDGYGNGAAVLATVNSSGQVASITVTTGGSGYIETPTLSWSASSTTNAVIEYRGETSAQCAISDEYKTRYVSRMVKLVDGFDASDLKVYVLGSRPAGTNIDAYYKVLSSADPTLFAQRPWQRMIMRPGTENVYTKDNSKVRDYEFRTKANSAAYTSNSITYDRFNVFAIKLVLRTDTESVVPRLKDLRAIALDV